MSERENTKSRFILAVFPVAIMLMLTGVEIAIRHHVLFTSLVSSIFLIYLKPDEPMNDSLTILISQGVAAIVGYTTYKFLGNAYWSIAITVITVTYVLVWINKLHPPAIATSLIFHYRTHSDSDLGLFMLLMGLIILLFLVKGVNAYLLKRLMAE